MKISWHTPKGRINRKAYFLRNLIMGLLATFLVFIVFSLFIYGMKENIWPILSLSGLCSVPLIYIIFGLYPVNMVKRLHDLNLSSWFFLPIYICLINAEKYPIVGIIGCIFSLLLFFKKGTIGTNKYGEDPLNENNKDNLVMLKNVDSCATNS